jgi:hypothetical protein
MNNKLIPTQEQQDIIHQAKTGTNLVIKAFAGAAKSSTCKMIAEEIKLPSLGIAFNSCIAKENESTFPIWVEWKTIHSLAWKTIIERKHSKMDKKCGFFLDIKDIEDARLPYGKEDKLKIQLEIIEIVKLFCQSDSYSLEYFIDTLDTSIIASKLVLGYWQNLINPDNPSKITPDIYLKMFHLTNPRLDYKIIYLDEAQDSNPVTLNIVLSQAQYGTQLILVGDSYQSIYEWRGAVDAMDNIAEIYNFKEMYLTESFRFTQEIADMASKLTYIAGNSKSIIGKKSARNGDDIKKSNTKATIVRNNSTLLTILLQAKIEHKKVYVLTDLKELWSKMYHISSLWSSSPVKYPNKELAQYKTFKELQIAYENLPELRKLVNLTTALSQGGLYNNITKIKSVIVDSIGKADFTLTTAHKSKGLEWDEVTITDDILYLKEGQEIIDVLMENQTLNLIYVALTRAKYKVNLPETVKDVIYNCEYFTYEWKYKLGEI